MLLLGPIGQASCMAKVRFQYRLLTSETLSRNYNNLESLENWEEKEKETDPAASIGIGQN